MPILNSEEVQDLKTRLRSLRAIVPVDQLIDVPDPDSHDKFRPCTDVHLDGIYQRLDHLVINLYVAYWAVRSNDNRYQNIRNSNKSAGELRQRITSLSNKAILDSAPLDVLVQQKTDAIFETTLERMEGAMPDEHPFGVSRAVLAGIVYLKNEGKVLIVLGRVKELVKRFVGTENFETRIENLVVKSLIMELWAQLDKLSESS